MKKLLCALIAVISVCTIAFTSCGSSDSNSATDTASKSSAENTTKDVIAIADKLHDEITFADSLNKFDDSKKDKQIKKILGIDKELYVNAQLYIGSGGATAEEIACFEAKDSECATKIKEACEARVESQKKSFENYRPNEMTKLNDPVIIADGNYVFMCISDDNDKAKEIIG